MTTMAMKMRMTMRITMTMAIMRMRMMGMRMIRTMMRITLKPSHKPCDMWHLPDFDGQQGI